MKKEIDPSKIISGIKRHVCRSDVNLEQLMETTFTGPSVKLTEHAYRFGNRVVKFYPVGSFETLVRCQDLGLPVEHPLAAGLNEEEGIEVLIIEAIKGRDYQEVVSEEKRFLWLPVINEHEMMQLGKTLYLFSKQGIIPGDTHLQNYMYDGKTALRIDLQPTNLVKVDIDWNAIERGEKAEGYAEKLMEIIEDIKPAVVHIAVLTAKMKDSIRRFRMNTNALLHGYTNDGTSLALATYLNQYSSKIGAQLQKAISERRSFADIHREDILAEAERTGKLTIRKFD